MQYPVRDKNSKIREFTKFREGMKEFRCFWTMHI